MVKEMKGTLYMIYANYKWSLITFWAILLGIVGISLISTYLIGAGRSEFSLSAPLYFYTPIVAAMIVTGIIPFMIKQGVTRFPIFLSLGIFLLVASILNAVFVQIINGLLKLIFGVRDGAILLKNGESEFSINHVSDLLPNASIFTEMTIDISITMLLSMIVFFVSLIFYRYGKLIAFSFMGIVGVLFVFDMTNQGAVFQLFEYIVTHFEFEYFYYMFGISIIVYLLSYVFMYNVTLKK